MLPDESPIEDAVSYILLTVRKPSADSPVQPQTAESCAAFSASIAAQTGAISVGELRSFTDADFKALELPAILRIYLKYLVRGTQSGRLASAKAAAAAAANGANDAASEDPADSVEPWLQSLQNDFNYGQSFDLSLYQAHLDVLALMGFGTRDALEALLLVDNRSVEAACELLLSTEPAARREKRAKLVEKLGRQVAPTRSASAAADAAGSLAAQQHAQAEQASAAGVAADANAAALLSLQSELSLLRSQLSREKSIRAAQASEISSFVAKQLPLKLYVEYLKAVLVKEYLLPEEVAHLAAFRERHGIDLAAHVGALLSLGIDSAAAFEARVRKTDRNKGGGPGKAASGGNQQQPGDMDCVVCLDKPKNHIIMNW